MKIGLIIPAVVIWTAATLTAGQTAADDIDSRLIAPDAIIQHAAQLNLSDQQLQKIRPLITDAQQQFEQLNEQVRDARKRLATTLTDEHIDEAAALKRLDRLLSAEQQHRHLHLKTLIRITGLLTAEQRTRAAALSAAGWVQDPGMSAKPHNPSENGPPRRLQTKAAKMQTLIQQMQKNRQDMSAVGRLMEKLNPLLQQKKYDAAEVVVDEVLKLAGEDAESQQNGLQNQQGAMQPPRHRLQHPGSPAALEREARSLKKPDVAWKTIAWKTCLLDGLRESRRQQKPLMLWVFIDRPIDDERC